MKISQTDTHFNGRRIWDFPDLLELAYQDGFTVEVTYDSGFEFHDWFINRVLVTQDDLIVELADCFDNDHEKAYIMDYERTEKAHAEFLKDHEVPY